MAAEITGGSLTQRLDAVSRDYRIAFSMGPILVGDTSAGVYARVWRVESTHDEGLQTGEVLLARSNAAGDGWEPATVVFAYSGVPINEVDLVFDQNGNAYVCAERASGVDDALEVWLYWFSPTAGTFVFEVMSPGKTPRLLLDAPFISSSLSDVLLFYLNDTNQRVEFRVQRELFDIVHLVPVDKWFDIETGSNILQDSTENLFLEEVAKAKDQRLHVLVSLRNPITGKYQLLVAESAPYPIPALESLPVDQTISELNVVEYIIARSFEEGMLPRQTILSVDLSAFLIEVSKEGPDYYLRENEAISVAQAIQSVDVTLLLIIPPTQVDDTAIRPAQLISEMTHVLYIIVAPELTDAFRPAQTIQSVNLVTL